MKERLLIAITQCNAMDADNIEQEQDFVNPHRFR